MPGTDTYLGLRAFVDELVRCGLREACTSPGSRSTPLVLTLAREPRLRATSHLDERCAAFFALGLAKATGVPAALACTSGTAAANYAPAVIEAHEARVPLLVLTADRPPELRDVGAGQTIDQVKLYGSAAKWYFEVDDHPASAARVRWLRQLACRAFWTAVEGRPGPVHLNFSLREPLVPDGDGVPDVEIAPGRAGGRPWVTRPRTRAEAPVEALQAELDARPRAIVVAGRSEKGFGADARRVRGAGRDPAARRPALRRAAGARGDRALRRAAAQRVAARRPTSCCAWATSPPRSRCAPGSRRWTRFRSASTPRPPGRTPRAPSARSSPPTRGARSTRWPPSAARTAAGSTPGTPPTAPPPRAIASVLGDLSEPRVAAELGSALPDDATLFVASSMPVRDVETFFPARPAAFRVLANRGANGIDGTVSTAFGVAAAARGPVVLLIGDVALAHDIGGLLAASRLGLKLVIVLLDNDGGGIFHFLPAAREGDAFVEHIATPHGLDFSHAAALYSCGWERAADVETFRAALGRALAADRTTIVCVRTDREENVALHRRVWESVRAAA